MEVKKVYTHVWVRYRNNTYLFIELNLDKNLSIKAYEKRP